MSIGVILDEAKIMGINMNMVPFEGFKELKIKTYIVISTFELKKIINSSFSIYVRCSTQTSRVPGSWCQSLWLSIRSRT